MEFEKNKYYIIEICCGEKYGCSHKIANVSGLAKDIQKLLKDLNWKENLEKKAGGKVVRRYKLRMGLSSCPNACSRVHVQDIGITAVQYPEEITDACTLCGDCVAKCREDALKIENGKLLFDFDKCVQCIECAWVCKPGAIKPTPLKFRLHTAGRLGRHPRFGDTYPETLSYDDLLELLKTTLSDYLHEEQQRPFAAFAIERFANPG